MEPREPDIEILDDESIFEMVPTAYARSLGFADKGSPKAGRKCRHESEMAAQVMADLQAATGFDSYEAYLESLRRNDLYSGPNVADIIHEASIIAPHKCAIIDLLTDNFPNTPTDEASSLRAALRCKRLSAIETLANLREPSQSVKVQIVLAETGLWGAMDLDFINIIGLGLKLDPSFFQSLLVVQGTRLGGIGASLQSRSLGKAKEEIEDSVFRHFAILEHVVAIARNCPFFGPDAPPIILIAGSGLFGRHIEENVTLNWLREVLPSQFPVNEGKSPRVPTSGKGNAATYTRLLTASIAQNIEHDISTGSLLLGPLLPLLRLDNLRMRARYLQIRRIFTDLKDRQLQGFFIHVDLPEKRTSRGSLITEDKISSQGNVESPTILYQCRTALRSLAEDFEDTTESLVRFTAKRIAPQAIASPAYRRISEDKTLLLNETCRLEAEIRDFLQLQVGQLSLLKSRKSIKVSNNQLQESKRAKIFTILAFVYVPLNLATSLFGMNIQQLNGSGRSLQTFVVTAIVALAITGTSWWLTEQLSSLRTWRNRDPDHYEGPSTIEAYGRVSPNYSLAVRIAMLVWLVRHGHSSWMTKSGAVWCVLTNSRTGFRPDPNFSGYWPESAKGLCAGDYLSRNIRRYEGIYRPVDFSFLGGGWKLDQPPEPVIVFPPPPPVPRPLDQNPV